MEVLATTSNLRMSARKVRLVADSVRGKSATRAIAQLHMLPKSASLPVRKLIESAVANAQHNFNIDRDNLYVKTIMVDKGPMLKRWRARAFGRAAPIAKHSCHIMIALAPIQEVSTIQKRKDAKMVEATLVKGKVASGSAKSMPEVDVPMPERAQESHAGEPIDTRREGGHRHMQHQDKRTMKGSGGTVKKIFNRKAG